MGTLWEENGELKCNVGCTTLIECDTCPCAADPCEYCADCTPREYKLTFADVDICNDCHSDGLIYSWKYSITSIDGDYYLEQSSEDPCCWIYRGTTGAWTWRRYSYDDWCAGTYVQGNLTPTFIFVKTTEGYLIRVIGLPTAADETTYGAICIPVVFSGGELEAELYDCDTTISDIPNDSVCATAKDDYLDICNETSQSYCHYDGENGTVTVDSQGC